MIKYLLLFTVALLLASCGESEHKTAPSQSAVTLTVLAGSELKDLEPLLPSIERVTGIKLSLRYAGTLDAVEKLQAGEIYDFSWLSSNKYALLTPGARERILAAEKTMVTPVVLGIKESKAKDLGWLNNPNVTWKDIAQEAGKGRFTFGMTNPASSNSGFSGLLGLAAALSGKGDALEVADIDSKQLQAFFSAQKLTSGSSGWLAEAYVKEQDRLDGMVNYASTLLLLNRNPAMREKLSLIYPKDGILSADYPLMLINAGRRPEFEKLTAYVRGKEFQQALMNATLRRPINPEIKVDPVLLTSSTIADLSFPGRLEVIDAILEAFDNRLRRPADSTFVLDVSGSMAGERLTQMKRAMEVLTGGDSSISGRYAKFRQRERIVLVPFNSRPLRASLFEMSENAQANQQVFSAIRNEVMALNANGGTAIFSATRKAYEDALERKKASKDDRYRSIVVMTDGENTHGDKERDFEQWYENLPAADRGIKIFPVLFGDAKVAELERLATLTGGRVFDGRKTSLATVFKEIRGYQ